MKQTVISDFIYYKGDFAGEHGDFNGPEAAIDDGKRREYLARYSDFLRKENGLGSCSKQAVEAEEVVKALQKVDYEVLPKVRNVQNLTQMNAALLPKAEVYKGWQLYTGRAEVTGGGALVFNDGILPPVPCAKYCFENGEKLKRISLKIYISRDYKKEKFSLSEEKAPHATTTGRILELRSGLQEIIKIQFYSRGEAYARIGVPDVFHHRAVSIGKFDFDKWNELTVDISGGVFNVTLNGQATENLQLTSEQKPDTLFLSGGFHPRGVWKVEPVAFEYVGGIVKDFFVPAEKQAPKERNIGLVKLPYAVGGFQNRDNYLILRGSFDGVSGKRAILTLDTLDPGGTVYLNGKLVSSIDTFEKQRIDITSHVKDGENTLTLVVEPRAPEIHYSWHRNTDTYHAWFGGKVKVEFLSDNYIEKVEAETLSVGDGFVEALIKTKVCGNAKNLKIFLQRTNPERGEEQLVYDGAFAEELKLKINAQTWSPQSPNLYALRAQIDGDDFAVETGFRTIEQRNGEILLNSEKVLLRGALLMQFLPPYENIVVSHVCPTDREIVWQLRLLSGMNANLARLHQLGYGTNDERYARYCDRLGMMLIWTTRYIDSLEIVRWGCDWTMGEAYVRQIEEMKAHPSIIMWEGSNEYRAADGDDIDKMYDEFVSYVKKVDTSRLLCPCSHLYYGGDLSGKGFYYQEDGKADQDFNPVQSSLGWNDELVVRSAHPYYLTLGYGMKWNRLRKQNWSAQESMLSSKKHSYLISEMATIGRHDDTVPECREYVKNDSYELSDEWHTFGYNLKQSDWRISQAYQALAASKSIRLLRFLDVDGIAWCCLSGGANDASYLKPPIDFYGYAKYAYYTMRDSYAETICCNALTDVVFGKNTFIKPCILGAKPKKVYEAHIRITDERDNVFDEITYHDIRGGYKIELDPFKPHLVADGYYKVHYFLTEK